MSVHQSNLDCRLKHIFEPCGQNKWLLRVSIYRFVTKTTLNNSNISIAVWLLNQKPITTVQASWETVRKLCWWDHVVPVTYNPQNHVEVLLDLIGQKSRPRLRFAVRSQLDIRWLCHGSAYRKTSCTASGHQLPSHKTRLTRAKSIVWQLIDIVDMISIIMFDMSTHDFACRQEH